jgi:hypothetical protein
MSVGRFEPGWEMQKGAVDGLASLAEMTMVVVVEDNVIDGDQSGVDQRFKLSFVVSFHDHQLPNFQGRTLWTSRVLDCACCRICTSDDINHLAQGCRKRRRVHTSKEVRWDFRFSSDV